MKGSGTGFDCEASESGRGVILNAPIHAPFIPTLAAAIRGGAIWGQGKPEPHELAQLTIYLPTHGSVEPLKLAFLAQSPNRATFLPRIRVLGDSDPLDLFALYGTTMASTGQALELLDKALAVQPPFDELERQMQLAALVSRAAGSLRSGAHGIDEVFLKIAAPSAFSMAGEIAALIGEAHAEGADLSRIAVLDSGQSSGSEQLSLQLLRSVLRSWQRYGDKAGKLDREERRNRLMTLEAEFIRHSDTPLIIAGSTGSIAATEGMMEAALSRGNSALVLYGLDCNVGAAWWGSLGSHPEHPLHGLHQLLGRLNLDPKEIRSLDPFFPPRPAADRQPRRAAALPEIEGTERRARFLSAALLPASATAEWAPLIRRLKEEGGHPAPGLSLIEAGAIQDEAAAIAFILRESLETEGQTAALITPSESLLNRVRHALAEWDLHSSPLPSSGDDLAARVVSCAASGKPEDFVELLRQIAIAEGTRHARAAEIIDLGVLRQMWRPSSLAGIPAALSRAEHAISSGEARHPAIRRIAAAEWDAARSIASQIIGALTPLLAEAGKRLPLPRWLAAHRSVLPALASLGLDRTAQEDEDDSTLRKLQEAPPQAFALDLAEYAGLFAEATSVRRPKAQEGAHPRLFLWKPLDARLLTAGVAVLGGLNEGCWPQAPAPSPWLSRRDRTFAGLPPQERRVGQAAHDFMALAASAPRVVLTRSKKVNGTLARPSRWISRIKALAAGAGQLQALNTERPWLAMVAAHRAPGRPSPAGRPHPCPPISARPRRLSVTAIETWFANPYAIYARHILGLEPLRRLGETNDARDKGILYHAALHSFFQAYPLALPGNPAEELLRKLDKAAGELGFNLENAPFWRPRFARFADWFGGTEGGRRAGVTILKSEVGGKLRVDAPAGTFEITARADRIDRLQDGSLRIYDFKTSANAAKISAARGAPQLALEGLLAREGAFAGIPAGSEAELFYIVAAGGEPPGEIVPLRVPSEEAIDAAYAGTLQRIARFDSQSTAYTYESRAIFQDKAENDPYAHLARVQEWPGGADDGEAGDD
jgi:ATP-dependent helicase/nuclease subunit B